MCDCGYVIESGFALSRWARATQINSVWELEGCVCRDACVCVCASEYVMGCSGNYEADDVLMTTKRGRKAQFSKWAKSMRSGQD